MKHPTRRALCLCVALAFVLCGCHTDLPETAPVTATETSPDTPVDTGEPTVISLPYNAEDTLSPYASSSRINLDLCMLIFDRLTLCDGTFTPQNVMAEKIVAEDLSLLVTLKPGLFFSDGTPVKAEHIVTSYNRARYAARYSSLLTDFTGAVAVGDNAVRFSLSRNNPNADACLSFPIYKEEDGVLFGSGLYAYDAENGCLRRNAFCGRAATVPETVPLYNVAREDALLYALESGRISYYFDTISDGSLPHAVSAGMTVDLPYLVFLGLNRSTAFSSSALRQAASAAIDRTVLVSGGFTGYAEPAVSPFHPRWKKAEGLYCFSTTAATDSAAALLGTLKSSPKPFELIYVTGNTAKKTVVTQIVEQLAAVGIRATPVELSYTVYKQRISSGDYGAYLGEIRLPQVYDLRSVFAVTGYGSAYSKYAAYLDGTGSPEEVVAAFADEMPFIPLCYRKGSALFTRSLHVTAPLADHVYADFEHWSVS